MQIDKFNDDEYALIRKQVSEERRKLCERFRFTDDKKRALLGEYLILNMVSTCANVPLSEVIIYKDVNGKPYVDSKYGVYVNVSHSGRYVVGIISDKKCGIDVEKIEDLELSMFDTVFTKQEMQYIYSFPIEKQLEKFYEIWTIKESYTKFVGLGLGIELDSFNVIKDGKITASLQVGDESCNIEVIDIDNNYKLAVSYLDDKYPIIHGQVK